MADLKPIGSEKLQGDDKIKRILEIARYKETTPSNINETSRVEFGRTLADGNQYEIVKEKLGYIIKKRIDESLEYIDPMKNRKYFSSYSQALKRLNLLAGEINRLTENTEEISMYGLSEQKKFTLKTPKAVAPAPAPSPAPEAPAPAPSPESEPESMDLSMGSEDSETPTDLSVGDEMSLDTPEGDIEMDSEVSMDDSGEAEEVDFKMIQKLTGKLGQKIRMMNDAVGMTSEDVKYVINSILSALDLSKLDEEDKEDIMVKFEEDSDYGMEGGKDFDLSGDEELSMDDEFDFSTEDEPMEGEMSEEDMYLGIGDHGFYDKHDRQMKDFDFDYDEEEYDDFDEFVSKYPNQNWFPIDDRDERPFDFKLRPGRRHWDMYKEKFGGPFKLRKRRSEDDMYSDSFDDRDSKVIGVYSNIKKQRNEMSEEEKDKSHVSKIMDAIFKESSVDKVLESYFVISEEETKTKKTKITENKNSVLSSVRKLAETFEQELASEFIIKENNNFKFVGKTNKKNLVFEHNGEQIKISPKGEVL